MLIVEPFKYPEFDTDYCELIQGKYDELEKNIPEIIDGENTPNSITGVNGLLAPAITINYVLTFLEEDEKKPQPKLTKEQQATFRRQFLDLAESICSFVAGQNIDDRDDFRYDVVEYIMDNLMPKITQYCYTGSQK